MWHLIILERTGRIKTVYSYLGHCTVQLYEAEGAKGAMNILSGCLG